MISVTAFFLVVVNRTKCYTIYSVFIILCLQQVRAKAASGGKLPLFFCPFLLTPQFLAYNAFGIVASPFYLKFRIFFFCKFHAFIPIFKAADDRSKFFSKLFFQLFFYIFHLPNVHSNQSPLKVNFPSRRIQCIERR